MRRLSIYLFVYLNIGGKGRNPLTCILHVKLSTMNIYVLEQWNKTHVVQLYGRRLTEIYCPKKIKSVIWTQPNPLDDWNLWPNPTRSKRPNQTQSNGWTQPHGRPHMGANGVSWPPGKMAEKLKSENMQKEQFSTFMLYFESNQGRQM